jgi:hypothetical protein
MTKEQAEYIFNILQEYGFESEINHKYSGRGMYGKTTSGIIVNNLLDVLHAVLQNHCDIINDDPPSFLKRLKIDNMGMLIILY